MGKIDLLAKLAKKTSPSGMTKVEFTKQLRNIFGKSKTLDELVAQTPKKAVGFINKVTLDEEMVGSGKYAPKELIFGKSADLQTVLHEVEHAIQDMISTRLNRPSHYPLYKSEMEGMANEITRRRAKNLGLPYEFSDKLPQKLSRKLDKYENPYLFLRRYLSPPKWRE